MRKMVENLPILAYPLCLAPHWSDPIQISRFLVL